MTRSEMIEHLDPKRFIPFRLTMNSGEKFEVRHPENAILMRTDSLYVFQSARDSELEDFVVICHIHNICTIEKPVALGGVATGN